jgi:protein-L-isoaspartate(D-aspartate) O-methyltransferase
MVDIAALRTKMVDGQIRPNDVTDHRIIEAMLEVPREAFVPAARAELAYVDLNVAVGEGRHLIQPMILGRMLQEVDIRPSDAVLEIAGATGYGSAVAARLAARVVLVEENPVLADAARAALAAAGADTVTVVTGPHKAGAPAQAPFDVILVNGAVELLPDAFADQLADGGRLVVVVGAGQAARAMLYTRSGKDVSGRALFNASVPLLPGFSPEPAFVF